MTFCFESFADALRTGAPISAEDVLGARRWAWSDGGISPAEAETIFELNHLAQDPPAEWVDFFVEAITQYVVNREPPLGYVGQANADWLIAHIDRDGRVETLTELELLVKVLETALNAPPTLKAFALGQIEQVVISGEGPTRRGGDLRPCTVDAAEVALLRRLLFASGGDGAITVTRNEAELLWRIKNATLGADNAPEWQTLFVQAVGNHLMGYSSYRPLERNEAARLEAFVGDTRTNVGGFLSRVLRGGPIPAPRQPIDHEAAAVAAEEVTRSESDWLQRHIDADSHLDPLEEALLAFVTEAKGQTA